MTAALLGFGLLSAFVRLQLRTAVPMRDLTLLSRPPILAGIVMAVVAVGALAGLELMQELPYVLGKTPLLPWSEGVFDFGLSEFFTVAASGCLILVVGY